jgi:hypothetical protein
MERANNDKRSKRPARYKSALLVMHGRNRSDRSLLPGMWGEADA